MVYTYIVALTTLRRFRQALEVSMRLLKKLLQRLLFPQPVLF
jgi:hypothetical protein